MRFNNPQKDGELDQFTIRERKAQLIQKEKFSLPARDRLEKTLTLALTNTRDQAARLGTLYLRSRGIRSNLLPNVFVKVEMPAMLTMEMIPVKDVYPLDLDGLPAWIAYGRVESIEESLSKITSIVTFSVYVHADYDDTAAAGRADIGPPDPGDANEKVSSYRIADIQEQLVTNNEGNLENEIIVDLTLP